MTPRHRIESIAVIGAGAMGAQIAAHFANAGLSVLLLDVPPPDLTPEEHSKGLAHPTVRNRLARLGLERAQKARPPAFFLPEFAGRIAVGNLSDDAGRLAEADWIVEAVLEDLSVKKSVLETIDACRRPGTLVTTNTSGLSVAAMSEGRSHDFLAHFLGVHFFNPPRYMRLLEVIPTPHTAPGTLEFVRDFGDRILGKGIVVCRDTPGFIGNRIGIFTVMDALRRTLAGRLAFEEVDLLTGPLMGRPRSGTFRLCDLIGIDVLAFVARHLHGHLPDDPDRETFAIPPLLQTLLDRGWLGDKRGQGFYKRAGRDILALDPATMDYRPRRKAEVGDTLEALIASDTQQGRFAYEHLSAVLCYAATHALEIADDIVRIDDTMRLGFNWTMGPFEMWDAVGLPAIADRLAQENRPLPPAVDDLLKSGQTAFYVRKRGRKKYFDLATRSLRDLPMPPGVLLLSDFRTKQKTLGERPGATLLDLGDGIACLEIARPLDPFNPEDIAALSWALDIALQNFEGLVIAGPPGDFWASDPRGALDGLIADEKWEEINGRVRTIQAAVTGLRRTPLPVIAAVSGRTSGLGFTLALTAGRMQVLAESAMGFDELSIGLLPIGGGIIELLRRSVAGLPPGSDPYPAVKSLFETLRSGRLSGNAAEARQMNLLRAADGITMNPDRLLADAKALTLETTRTGGRPNFADTRIPVMGAPGLARLNLDLYTMRQAEILNEAGASVAAQLATVLCGGPLSGPQPVPWNYLLDLERETFLTLCRMKRT